MQNKHSNRFAATVFGLLIGLTSLQTACGNVDSASKSTATQSRKPTARSKDAGLAHGDERSETARETNYRSEDSENRDPNHQSESLATITYSKEWINADSPEMQHLMQTMNDLHTKANSEPEVSGPAPKGDKNDAPKADDTTASEEKAANEEAEQTKSKPLDELIADEFDAVSERYPEKLSKHDAKHYSHCFSLALLAAKTLNPWALVEAIDSLLDYYHDHYHDHKHTKGMNLADENSFANRITNLPSVFIDLFVELYAATLNADPSALASAAKSAVQRTVVAFEL